jgi:hypothetical protein
MRLALQEVVTSKDERIAALESLQSSGTVQAAGARAPRAWGATRG